MSELLDNLKRHLSEITKEEFQKEWDEIEKEGFEEPFKDECPKCGEPIIEKWSGVMQ